MKKLLLFYFLITGLVLPAQAQATYFTFDSIWSPPYICQATAINVEVFGTRSSMTVMDSTQNYFFSNDTIFVRFNFNNNGGLMISTPIHRQILIPAPPIGQYKIIVQGIIKGQVHRTIASTLSVCSTIAGTEEQKSGEFPVSVHPNPTSDLLTIILPESTQDILLTLTDAAGKQYLHRKIATTEQAELDLSEFSKGIYFLTLETERGRTVRKIVKN
jgi:hypothetical protein